jgi:hypothetical protein
MAVMAVIATGVWKSSKFQRQKKWGLLRLILFYRVGRQGYVDVFLDKKVRKKKGGAEKQKMGPLVKSTISMNL